MLQFLLMSNSTIFRSSFFLLTFILFLSSSCSDKDQSVLLSGTKTDILSMLQSEDITQRTSVASNNFIVHTERGTSIRAEPNSFVYEGSGALASGFIDFEVIELFTKSEILQYGIETRSNNSIIESDGEFLFSASQNGQSLRLANNKVLSLIVPNSNPNPGMELFGAGEGAWWPLGDSLNTFVSNGPDSFNAYGFDFDRLDWVNIDYFTKFDLDLTDISICLPEGYEENRIFSWVVFKNIDVVLNSSGESLPIGEVVSIVCIAAENENTFRIDIQEVTVEVGLKVNLNPQVKSVESIKDLLKGLD